jgi:hypothetical protein
MPQGQVVGHDQGMNGATDDLHFDHTSTLKTVARRFMSDYPPYMGPRYAAAKDLTAVMGNTLRQTQFLPFIRYDIIYNSSLKSLDVPGGSNAPGIDLWQYDVNDTEAQHFSFEDAGDGLFYIRTHCGNLYLTVDVPPVVIVARETEAPTTPNYNIKQDIKYKQGAIGIGIIVGHPNPSYQKWRISAAGIVIALGNTSYTISNPAFPGKVLQPVNLLSGAKVILGDPDPGNTPLVHKNTWKITSPLINYQVVTKPIP